MRLGSWFELLATHLPSLRHLRRRTINHHVRRAGGIAHSHSPAVAEELEPRLLLSGVTLITHGHSDDTAGGGWVRAMGNAMMERAGYEMPYAPGFTEVQLKVASTDEATLKVTLAEVTLASTAPLESIDDGGDIIVYLDWSNAQSAVSSEAPYNTVAVSDAITPYLLGQQPITGLAHPLAEQPIHLLGHGRGGSLVGAIAESLGEAGVFVDQVTYLDPSPLEPGDYPVSELTVPRNVVFADTIWRTNGAFGDWGTLTVLISLAPTTVSFPKICSGATSLSYLVYLKLLDMSSNMPTYTSGITARFPPPRHPYPTTAPSTSRSSGTAATNPNAGNPVLPPAGLEAFPGRPKS